jgi:hypothetical protein
MAATDLTARLRRLQSQLLNLADVAEGFAREIAAVTDASIASTQCPDCQRRRTAKTQAMRRYRASRREISA